MAYCSICREQIKGLVNTDTNVLIEGQWCYYALCPNCAYVLGKILLKGRKKGKLEGA